MSRTGHHGGGGRPARVPVRFTHHLRHGDLAPAPRSRGFRAGDRWDAGAPHRSGSAQPSTQSREQAVADDHAEYDGGVPAGELRGT